VQSFKISIFSLIFVLVILLLTIHYRLDVKNSIILDIASGSSTSSIATSLYENKIILNPTVFNIYVRISSNDHKIKAGEYEFKSAQSMHTIIGKLTKGDFFYRKLTLLPGSTISNILKLGNSEGLINDLVTDPEKVLKDQGIKLQEGIFFPDTFFYLKGENFSSVLLKSNEKWKKISKELWKKRNLNLPFNNINEAVTLASIIEKEGLEKRKIAGVFVNRLNKNMKLQSDPTVIYALGNEFDGNLTRKNLRIDNPYNTYRYKGLPPGPISIVSYNSLEAALNPLITDYLYFVSMGNGFHKFSKTLTEHNEAVLKYQIDDR
tara:strand:+ start:1253 stop:2212 length:960 start_codon:yes stop_codon:yes gene_type:complete